MKKNIFLIFAALLIFSGCGTSTNVGVFAEDNLSVVVLDPEDVAQDFRLNIARNIYPEFTGNYKFCEGTVGASDTVIWDGGNGYDFLNSAETLNISSTSALDTYGGSGAWNVIVYGLDNNYNQITEVVNLSGTAVVQTQQQFRRTNRAFVILTGSPSAVGGSNVGTITFTSATTDSLQAAIRPNVGQTLMCVYTVPANHTMYITGFSISSPEGKYLVASYKARNCDNDLVCSFSTKIIHYINQEYVDGIFTTPSSVPQKTDVLLVARTTSSTSSAAASFGFILENNSMSQ